MTTRAKIATTVLLLVGLAGVGIADYQFAGREYAANLIGSTSSDGVAKAGELNVQETLGALNLVSQQSDDLTFLAQVSRETPVQSLAILDQNDRIGSVSWVDGDAKQFFIALKEALLSAFSDKVENLSDRTLQEEGQPVRNVLTFRDPALSEESLTFVRIRERLYEFHSAQGKEAAMQQVIDALITR